MKMVALRDLTREELLQRKRELTEEMFNLNMRRTMKELDNPLKLRTLRRDIARIETILTEDQRGIKRIVEAPVSILDKKVGKEPDAKVEKAE